jgi:hypothetical protein
MKLADISLMLILPRFLWKYTGACRLGGLLLFCWNYPVVPLVSSALCSTYAWYLLVIRKKPQVLRSILLLLSMAWGKKSCTNECGHRLCASPAEVQRGDSWKDGGSYSLSPTKWRGKLLLVYSS